MAGNTFIQVPIDLSDTAQLRRFLSELVEKIDIAYGNRGDDKFTSNSELELETSRYEPKFSKNSAFNKSFGTTRGTVTEGGTTTNNPIGSSIENLNLTISDPPTQEEVQAISDKVDILLLSLRLSNLIT